MDSTQSRWRQSDTEASCSTSEVAMTTETRGVRSSHTHTASVACVGFQRISKCCPRATSGTSSSNSEVCKAETVRRRICNAGQSCGQAVHRDPSKGWRDNLSVISMEQSPSWEADGCADSHPILRQVNPMNTLNPAISSSSPWSSHLFHACYMFKLAL